jgi:dTDP-4-dehydrorhamnose reductase
MRIVVVGAKGQLAASVVHEASRRHEVIALDRASLDVTDGAAVDRTIRELRPDAIVNGAAYNAVDAAETHAVEALRLNAFAVRALARAACAAGASLVHYGSDFVFDGTASQPYREDDPPNPRSVYATSKLLGEWFAVDAPRAYVLRVESIFGVAPGAGGAKGSVATIVNTLRAGGVPKVFEDRTVSPTFVMDAAHATLTLLERHAAPGLYHCVNTGHCTWLELAREAARLLDVPPRFEVVRVADVTLPAARPQYCALSNEKLTRAGFEMPSWQDALARYLQGALA